MVIVWVVLGMGGALFVIARWMLLGRREYLPVLPIDCPQNLRILSFLLMMAQQ